MTTEKIIIANNTCKIILITSSMLVENILYDGLFFEYSTGTSSVDEPVGLHLI